MSMNYNQIPADISLTQSPTILSVTWDGYETSSGFQYVCDLYYWTGSQADRPTTSQYTLVKYPNSAGAGIFDFSRIINSTLDKPNEDLGGDNAKWFSYDVYFQYLTGSSYVTGSHSGVWNNEYLAIDGYQLFGQSIQQAGSVSQSFSDFFPILTDGPATQSVFYNCDENFYQNDLSPGIVLYEPNHSFTENGYITTGFYFDCYTSNGVVPLNFDFNTGSFQSGSNYVIQKFNISPNYVKSLLETYTTSSFSTVTAYDFGLRTYGAQRYGTPLHFEIENLQKYPNVQLMWKNRYGEMDYYNFNMVSKQSFDISRSQYQPQIGTWNSSTLGYNTYETAIQNYLVDTNTSLTVNTNWVSEEYNQIFKQLLVSDEIYWIFDPIAHQLDFADGIRTMTIKTSNFQLKTGVVDKLIQYTFDLDFGQSYKLIL
jgi:hypothetical protein